MQCLDTMSRNLVFLLASSSFLHADPPSGVKWRPIPELTDEFEGPELDAGKWHDHNPRWKGRQPGLFSRDNVQVSGGRLHLTATVEERSDFPTGYHTFTTAAVKSKALVKYGFFEVKCKPMKSRASSAFWFYQNTKREWTEIDVFEIGGGSPKHEASCHMNVHVFHGPLFKGTVKKHLSRPFAWKAPRPLADDYHVYALQWDEKAIKWYFDGKVVRSIENTHWHQPLHMNFDSETMPKWFGLPVRENLPSTFSIEYVRSWKRTESTPVRPRD